MTQTTTIHADRIGALLAEKGYEVSVQGEGVLRIREVGSGIAIQAVLEGGIVFFSLTCATVPAASITAPLMRKMLAADNGISTSYFQLYDHGNGTAAITLNNFCKLQDMGPDDEDDVLSSVHFLLADVLEARRLIGGMLV
jgi:hypothetical protein